MYDKFLTESEVRRAMGLTKSNRAAAIYLKVSYPTYKKYAKQYIDENTGQSLFTMHLNKEGIGVQKSFSLYHGNYTPVEDILQGKFLKYPLQKLKTRLITHRLIEDKCAVCGFDEKRVTDYKAPLLLSQIDGNPNNYSLENLELLCYNHYFLMVGNIGKNKKNFNKILSEDDEGAKL